MYQNIKLCNYENMKIYKYTNMEIWKYANILVEKYICEKCKRVYKESKYIYEKLQSNIQQKRYQGNK